MMSLQEVFSSKRFVCNIYLLTITSDGGIILYESWSAGTVPPIWVQVSVLPTGTAVGARVVVTVV